MIIEMSSDQIKSYFLRPLPGFLLVSRDPDIDRTGLIYHPDVEKRRSQSGFVHLHNVSGFWDYPSLTNKHILYSKYAEREFTLGGRTFCTVDERDVLAVFLRRSNMQKSTFLEEINKKLGEVEGDELSANDLTALADEVVAMSEVEGDLEDEDGQPDDEEPTDPSKLDVEGSNR